MENIFKNKLNLFYLGVGLVLVVTVIIIVLFLVFPRSEQNNTDTLSTLPSPTIKLSPPVLQSTIAPTKQGVFTVSFPKAPDPKAFTITLSSSSVAGSQTVSVPFTSSFQNNGLLLVITTKNALLSNVTYTLYVRLISNNHIVVKHRYKSVNGALTIIDTN